MNPREEGENGLLMTWPGLSPGETRARIRLLRERLTAPEFKRGIGRAVEESVPALESLLVLYDPQVTEPEPLAEAIRPLDGVAAAASVPREIEIEVKYGGSEGADIDRVARASGRAVEDIVRMHSGAAHEVAFLGFMPGFAYIAGLPSELAVPRLDSPRTRVPAGSVAVAGSFTGIYPGPSPGGWNLIGRTAAPLWDIARPEPALLGPGDRVRFLPVSEWKEKPRPQAAAARTDPEPVLAVEAAGLVTTIQDLGRPGHAHLGVSPSGPMDPLAFRLANLAAGNGSGAAGLEFTFPAPRLRALAGLSLALGGADFAARIDGRAVPYFERLDLKAGDELRFERPVAGQWGYLALAGGIAAPRVLGSAAADLRSGIGGRIEVGARLARERPPSADGRRIPPGLAPLPSDGIAVRAVPAEGLPLPPQGLFLTLTPQRDRGGYRTSCSEGSLLSITGGGTLPSEGIPAGTVQLPPDGRPIALLAERPTTGGYRKLAFIASVDLRLIAQLPPGARLRLVPIEAAEGRRLVRAEREALSRFG